MWPDCCIGGPPLCVAWTDGVADFDCEVDLFCLVPFKRNLSANGTCDFSEFFCDLICGGLSEPSGPSSVWFDSAASIGVIWRGSGMIETSRWRTSDLDWGR